MSDKLMAGVALSQGRLATESAGAGRDDAGTYAVLCPGCGEPTLVADGLGFRAGDETVTSIALCGIEDGRYDHFHMTVNDGFPFDLPVPGDSVCDVMLAMKCTRPPCRTVSVLAMHQVDGRSLSQIHTYKEPEHAD